MSELPFESPEHPLRGETVVFTGKLWSLGRKEARAVVERLGGSADEEVTLRTTLLVVGGESYPDGVPDISRLANEQGTQRWKLRRAGSRSILFSNIMTLRAVTITPSTAR